VCVCSVGCLCFDLVEIGLVEMVVFDFVCVVYYVWLFEQ